jgi:transcriptional regulator with XRE-family HTH domain
VAGRRTEPFKVVGERLAALRSSHGLTQRALGEKIGQPHTYVGKLEIAERRLDILDVATLALAFAMSPAELTTYLLGAADAAEPKAQ